VRRIALTIVSTIAGLVILLTLKANTAPAPAAASTPPAIVAAAPTSAAPAATGSTAAGSKAAPAPASKTVQGTAVKNQYESFQVQLTVAGSKVTKVEILDLVTPEPTSKQIAGGALPKLQQETLTNSTKVDAVSGATYTSKSYKESLQAALDKAGL
jgi:uncharacterized protein with FMN-binding domain